MQRNIPRLIGGNIFFGASLGLFLEWFNITIGGLTTTLPTPWGPFRLHHIWIGMILTGLGIYGRLPLFVGLGLVLIAGDYYEHQRSDGSVAPFW